MNLQNDGFGSGYICDFTKIMLKILVFILIKKQLTNLLIYKIICTGNINYADS